MMRKPTKMASAPSEDSDQPGHPPSLLSLRCLHDESLCPQLPIERTAQANAQADLSSLVAHAILLVLSCTGSSIFNLPD